MWQCRRISLKASFYIDTNNWLLRAACSIAGRRELFSYHCLRASFTYRFIIKQAWIIKFFLKKKKKKKIDVVNEPENL